jgi:hypothetical protein
MWKAHDLTRKIKEVCRKAKNGKASQEDLDSVMQLVVKIMLECEEAVDTNYDKKQKKKNKLGWSHKFMQQLSAKFKFKFIFSNMKNGRT